MQIGYTAIETIKSNFEWMASNFNVQVHAYHADIGIYHSKPRAKIQDEWVSAQFQNRAVESTIMSVFQFSLAMMLHAQIRWPAVPDESLLPYALPVCCVLTQYHAY